MTADTAIRVYSGDALVDGVRGDDRGIAYGDGLFETMRAHGGGLPWWPRHWRRLCEGAERLGLRLPDEGAVQDGIDGLLAARGGDGVIRLVVTRGGGGRGYKPPPAAVPTWILSHHPAPVSSGPGLALRWCDLRWARQPRLAGIKHCNRLEQVLARAECDADGCDEGLVMDADGHVVSATSANLLVLRDGAWTTPSVDGCGVAGTCRGWLLERGLVAERVLSREAVEGADALALCNAVRGILPVARLGGRDRATHPGVATLQRALSQAHPAFSAPSVPEVP
ncbi:aminodeoxychorismate lyase [Luteimonas pelagia]